MLYVVRHGETNWNRERRLQGHLDVPLNRIGLAQAHALARYFEDRSLSRVLTSPLRRASVTAAILAELAHCPLEQAGELAEIHHGAWQGLTSDDIQAQSPDLWAQWKAQPSRTQPPGAESVSAVWERVDRLLQRLPRDEDLCLVTHGVVSQALVARLMGLDPDAIFTITQLNGCINVFEVGNAGAVAKALNVTTHLQAAEVGQS
jgi:broad specificity phosphatase PhoE